MTINRKPIFRRVLLKLSGEALMGDEGFGIDPKVLDRMAQEIKELVELDVEVGLVIGGGNFLRGGSLAEAGMNRVVGDHMGMLATVMNALALQDAMKHEGLVSRVQSAINIDQIVEPYIRGKAITYLEEKRIVIFAAGTGNPFFTTDTAAALRASEMGCQALFKATKVDGVYSADPVKDPKAKRFETLSYLDVLSRDLKVMDAAAISLARENNISILVFSIHIPGAFAEVIRGNGTFTIISEKI